MSGPARQALFGDPACREPVFIVGMNGSGTTMLLDCLSRHSQVYGYPRETRVIPYLMEAHGAFGTLQDDANFRRLWDYLVNVPAFRMENDDAALAMPDGWQYCTRDLAGLLNMAFLTHALAEGKARWCEKTPMHARHMTALQALFPHARFIHMLRDGRDCAGSLHRRWGRTAELTMTRWKQTVRDARRQGQALGDHYLEVRFEDLTSAPDRWMPRICEFLGVGFEPAVLMSSQPYLNSSRHKTGIEGKLRANSERWRSYFSPRAVARLDAIGGRLLADLGYPSGAPEGDRTPSAMRRRLWGLRDSVYQFGREVSLKLRGRIERPWRTILARPFEAYRNRNGKVLQ